MSCPALEEENEDETALVSESSDSERTELEEQFGSPPPEEVTTDNEDVCLPELSREQIDVLLKVSCIAQVSTIPITYV